MLTMWMCILNVQKWSQNWCGGSIRFTIYLFGNNMMCQILELGQVIWDNVTITELKPIKSPRWFSVFYLIMFSISWVSVWLCSWHEIYKRISISTWISSSPLYVTYSAHIPNPGRRWNRHSHVSHIYSSFSGGKWSMIWKR